MGPFTLDSPATPDDVLARLPVLAPQISVAPASARGRSHGALVIRVNGPRFRAWIEDGRRSGLTQSVGPVADGIVVRMGNGARLTGRVRLSRGEQLGLPIWAAAPVILGTASGAWLSLAPILLLWAVVGVLWWWQVVPPREAALRDFLERVSSQSAPDCDAPASRSPVG
jgi:hypothetical protein